jgi:hypothetical protein
MYTLNLKNEFNERIVIGKSNFSIYNFVLNTKDIKMGITVEIDQWYDHNFQWSTIGPRSNIYIFGGYGIKCTI